MCSRRVGETLVHLLRRLCFYNQLSVCFWKYLVSTPTTEASPFEIQNSQILEVKLIISILD